MAYRIAPAPSLYEALKAEGYDMPAECADVFLTMPVDGMYQLHYTINVQRDELLKIGRALVRLAGIEPPAMIEVTDYTTDETINRQLKLAGIEPNSSERPEEWR